MEVTYKKNLNSREVITEEQAILLDGYYKIVKNNTLIKRIEYYEDNDIHSITYYLDSSEVEQEILNQLFEIVNYVGIVDRKITLGEYFIEVERGYTKGDEENFYLYNRLYDIEDRLICFQENTNNVIYYGGTEKFCYFSIARKSSSSELTDYFLQFFYDDEGELIFMELFGAKDTYEPHLSTKSIIEVIDFESLEEEMNISLPANYEYYLNASFEP